MNAQKYRIALFSKNPDKLAHFYTKVLGFTQTAKIVTREDYGYSIEIAKGYKLWIAKHSEIRLKNQNPFRIVISIYVSNIDTYFKAIYKYPYAKVVEEPTLACKGIKGEERIVGAFLDPEDNCIQLMQLTGN